VNELPDGTHPNDEGFQKIAAMWIDAIEEAEKKVSFPFLFELSLL